MKTSKILDQYPSQEPSDPDLIPAYERSQLKLHQLLFQNLPDGVIATDPLGIITDANPAALEIFGYHPHQLIGTPIFIYLEDEYGVSLAQAMSHVIEGAGSVRNRHVFVKRFDDTRRSCTLSIGPMVKDGELLRSFGIFRDRTELERLVQIDQKTGLLNERTFLQRVEEQIKMSRRKDEPLAMVYFDMRCFKPLNDRFGHAEGDRVIKKVGLRLDQAVFQSDFRARLHGDEFAALLTRIGREDLELAASKLAKAMSFEIDLVDPHTGRIESAQVQADIGIVWRKGADIPDAEALLELADKRMFSCKAAAKRGEVRTFCIDMGDKE